jgi:hypothetical protein
MPYERSQKVVSYSPIAREQFNLVPLYRYVTLSQSAGVLNSKLSLPTPNGGNLNANAVFIEPVVNNIQSPPRVTQDVLDTSVDLSVTDSSTLISSYQDFTDFLIPGVVRATKKRYGTEVSGEFNKLSIKSEKLSHPITVKVKSTIYNFIQRGSEIIAADYVYESALGLWSPNDWATVDFTAEKNYKASRPEIYYQSNTYRGYRMGSTSFAGTLDKMTVLLQPYTANLYYNGTTYGYSTSGYRYEYVVKNPGPPDPIGKKWCLGVDIQPAFRDNSGNVYYNKQIIVSDPIPEQKIGELFYS